MPPKKNNPHNIQVGDTLWTSYFLRTVPQFRQYTVSKVGLKYATVPGYLVDLVTLREKTNFTALQFGTSKEQLEEGINRHRALTQLHRDNFRWDKNKLTSAQLLLINSVLIGERPFEDLKDLC